jgi:hypothetical protein
MPFARKQQDRSTTSIPVPPAPVALFSVAFVCMPNFSLFFFSMTVVPAPVSSTKLPSTPFSWLNKCR